ncbi:DUF4440 domain-containing protein [Yersinia nurmii]|uniref:DUF4440 domain-containing protein n=1 Tax=Yersinia nurmii TaxID=685706 RepID=A0AAW7KAZ0_9GAMM|nr:cytoplasmic protein [Yersinia nurmii]MDN0089175.1 DUF4440 domain-containing protein [Yersinia nurmii]CNF20985.1 Uncharacterized protein conserved in bacteria [Yersinia nurmii]
MNNANPYFDLISSSHQLIEQWFSGRDTHPEVCEHLLRDFSPQYTMITLTGHALDYSALCQFFRAQSAAKPELTICLSEMTLIQESSQGAVVSYLEQQKMPNQPLHRRLSTAIFDKTTEGKVLWRHLHETLAG